MVALVQVENMIKTKLPGAQIIIKDLTGGGDHFEVIVISTEFEGKTMIKQHQLVYSTLQDAIVSKSIHALGLKTYTPKTWEIAQRKVGTI